MLMELLSGDPDISMAEAMRMTLDMDKPKRIEEMEFSSGWWLDEILLRMKEAYYYLPEIPDSFLGEFCPY